MFEAYEIFLLKSAVSSTEWQNFINSLPLFHKILDSYKIEIQIENHLIHFILKTPRDLPPILNNTGNFLLKKVPYTSPQTSKKSKKSTLILTKNKNSIPKLNSFLSLHHNSEIKSLTFSFKKLSLKNTAVSAKLIDSKNCEYKLTFAVPSDFLSLNFETSKNFLRVTPPNFLDLSKSLSLFSPQKSFAKIDTFPYSSAQSFLNPSKIDFEKHMIVFGASGSGKSKFLSLLVENYLTNKLYKVIILDPHASLENDLGGLAKVIDFNSSEDSINLFESTSDNVVVATELLLDTFLNLLDSKNPKLERVLHHSFFLLLALSNFDFKTLRQLLLETEFRNNLITKNQKILPANLVTFFLTEFSEIKTEAFNEAVAPIITLIDELEALPAFQNIHVTKSLLTTLLENQLTIFSLNRSVLGSRGVKTLSSFVMCQLFNLIQNHEIKEHLIFIIDEVAVIENPILKRFLSESRKFNLTLILVGQYFSAITDELQAAIFSNVSNYCIFRVSKDDAALLVSNFNFKLSLNNSEAEKVKLLTGLKDRECVLRLSAGGKLIPAFKCFTMNFTSHPRKRKTSNLENQFKNLTPLQVTTNFQKPFSFAQNPSSSAKFSSATSANLREILTLTSTRRHSARELLNQK